MIGSIPAACCSGQLKAQDAFSPPSGLRRNPDSVSCPVSRSKFMFISFKTWRAIGASSCPAFSKWASLSSRLAEPPCVPSRRSSKCRIRLVMYAGIVLWDITLPPTNNQYLRGACTTYRSRRRHLLPSLVSAAALDEDHAGRRTCAALRNALFLGGPSYSSPPPVRWPFPAAAASQICALPTSRAPIPFGRSLSWMRRQQAGCEVLLLPGTSPRQVNHSGSRAPPKRNRLGGRWLLDPTRDVHCRCQSPRRFCEYFRVQCACVPLASSQ